MEIEFEKPPIIEIIAEVRWGEASSPAFLPGLAPNLMIADDQNDEFFRCFGEKAAAIGFSRSERLVPLNFPTMPFQPSIVIVRNLHLVQMSISWGKGFFPPTQHLRIDRGKISLQL